MESRPALLQLWPTDLDLFLLRIGFRNGRNVQKQRFHQGRISIIIEEALVQSVEVITSEGSVKLRQTLFEDSLNHRPHVR